MAYGEGVRFSVRAKDIKQTVQDAYGTKFRSIAKDPKINYVIAKLWAERVSRFVPRSEEPKTKHHLQKYSVSDGRVTWYRYNKAGDDITRMLYDGTGGKPRKDGGKSEYHYHSRTSSPYQPHEPRPEWDKAVRPGTNEWDDFVSDIYPILLGAFADQIKQ